MWGWIVYVFQGIGKLLKEISSMLAAEKETVVRDETSDAFKPSRDDVLADLGLQPREHEAGSGDPLRNSSSWEACADSGKQDGEGSESQH